MFAKIDRFELDDILTDPIFPERKGSVINVLCILYGGFGIRFYGWIRDTVDDVHFWVDYTHVTYYISN